MNLTPFTKPFLTRRVKQIARYATDAEAIQRDVLRHLVSEASGTEWGIKHKYSDIKQYEQFARIVDFQDYETL